MSDNRKTFLEKQINIYEILIDNLEHSNINRKEQKDLENFRALYLQYVDEYKGFAV